MKLSIKTKMRINSIVITILIIALVVISEIIVSKNISEYHKIEDLRKINTTLLSIERDHLEWVRKLNYSLMFKEKFTGQLNYRKCHFGKWYYSNKHNNEKFKSKDIRKIFKQFEEPHKKIHEAGKTIQSLMEQDKFDEAKAYYKNNFNKILIKFRTLLKKYRDKIKGVVRKEIIKLNKQFSFMKNFIVILGAIILTLTIFSSLYTLLAISKPLKNILTLILDIASGEGDLTKRVNLKRKDEIGIIGAKFDSFLENIHGIVKKIKILTWEITGESSTLSSRINKSSEVINTMVDDIKKIDSKMEEQNGFVSDTSSTLSEMVGNIESIASNIEQQSSAVEESSSSIEEMAANINSVALTAKKAYDISNALTKVAKEGGEIIQSSIDAIHEIEDSGTRMADIVEIISGIAEQTNLLAMNAAIEAAHAGQFGKGFAVVADEIRKLAENSASSAKEITGLIKENADKIAKTVDLATTANQGLDKILADVVLTLDINTEISSAMDEQSIAAKEILSSMSALVQITEHVRNAIQEQKTGSRDIINSIVDLEENARQILDSTQKLTENTDKVNSTFDETKKVTKDSIDKINDLYSLVGKFKVEKAQEKNVTIPDGKNS